jgi:hypothetical protein
MRLYRMKRKNRIDRYYSEVIRIRHAAENVSNDVDRGALVAKLKGIQDNAFAELVDEKLAANESFRIFITLSNDVLRQLGATTAAARNSDD